MLLLLSSLGVVAVSALSIVALHGATTRARERASGRLQARLSRDGALAFSGDPFDSFDLSGALDGVSFALSNRVQRNLPGTGPASDDAETVCVVELALPLPDLVVCRREDADRVMGPLPAVPSVSTGDARFDASHRMFVGSAGSGSPPPAGYRAPPPDALAAWMQTGALTALLDFGLRWVRVRDGKAEVAFKPQPLEQIQRVLTAAANLARSAAGGALRPLPASVSSIDVSDLPEPPSRAATAALLLFFGPFGAVLGFLKPLRDLNAAWACGPGAEIRVSSSSEDGGTTYGLYCSNDMSASLTGHYIACVLLLGAVACAVYAVLLALRVPRVVRAHDAVGVE